MHAECVSDNKSSNAVYLHKTGKGFARASSSAPHRSGDDIYIHSGQPKSTTRNPMWPEDHNVALGELLLEQYVNDNFYNGNLQKEQWSSLVAALNRRLGSNYIESSVIIRFKIMKADFRTLYQIKNRSGWDWDDDLHIPVAPDELWDEIVQVNPKLSRFRRHPFHQYEVFEKICVENIAIGTGARSSNVTEPMVNLDEDETPHFEDELMASNDVSYDMEGTSNSNLPEAIDGAPSENLDEKSMLRSTRSSEEPPRSTRRPKEKGDLDNLNRLLVESNKNAVVFKEIIQRSEPWTMTDCLAKLGQLENLTTQALLAVQDALKKNNDNKAVFMTWEGEVLAKWIEYVVSSHPRFYASKVWL